jgi:hypothetical protein
MYPPAYYTTSVIHTQSHIYHVFIQAYKHHSPRTHAYPFHIHSQQFCMHTITRIHNQSYYQTGQAYTNLPNLHSIHNYNLTTILHTSINIYTCCLSIYFNTSIILTHTYTSSTEICLVNHPSCTYTQMTSLTFFIPHTWRRPIHDTFTHSFPHLMYALYSCTLLHITYTHVYSFTLLHQSSPYHTYLPTLQHTHNIHLTIQP